MANLPRFAVILFAVSQLLMAADDKVTLNFVNSDIESTVRAVGLITGKNFVLDPRVKGVVNIVSASPMAKSEVYNVMLSALRLQGFSVVETGNLVRIVPEADAKQNYGITVEKKTDISGDRIITQIYPIKHESATQMLQILRPLVAPNNQIVAYPSSNLLVITDYADNIKRLNQIIASIDQPSTSDVFTLSLKFASAVEVAQTIGRLMPEVSTPGVSAQQSIPGQEGARKTVVIADARANALIVRGDNSAHIGQIKRIADSLDKQSALGGNIRVVYLKNAEATKLAPVLKSILTGQDIPQNPATNSFSGSNNSGAIATPASNPAQQTAFASNGSPPAGTISSGIAIQADPTTNSLIITAPDNVYNSLRGVIEKLDSRRAQVYVEALIAEVNVNKSGQFGIQWLLGGGNNKVTGIGSSNLASGGNSIASVAAGIASRDISALPGGFSIGVINGSLNDGGKLANLGVLATAIESNDGGNILSAPNILTLDNEEARIIVGQNVPFITGTQASTGNNPNPFTTVERKDVGIQLKVKPQVSEGGGITLQVYQEVSNVVNDNTINTGNAGLITAKRSIESKVLVDDGQIIVIGGLIQNDLSQSSSKVPLLGDIPFIGNFFRYESRSTKRTNLMVFLRPVILRDGLSAQALSNERYKLLQDTQKGYKHDSHWMLPTQPEVVLPLLDARPKAGQPEPAKP
jgi:general secretion pathway protein D